MALLFLNLTGMLPIQAGFCIVFSSSPLGQTLCLFVERKDVIAHSLGEREAALVFLFYLFVIFVAWFLKISSLLSHVICLSSYTILLGFIGKFHSKLTEVLEISVMLDVCKF